jgi:hypothetical protein
MKIDIPALAFQDRIDPLDRVIRPTQPVMVGVENKHVASISLLRMYDHGEKEEKEEKQGYEEYAAHGLPDHFTS